MRGVLLFRSMFYTCSIGFKFVDCGDHSNTLVPSLVNQFVTIRSTWKRVLSVLLICEKKTFEKVSLVLPSIIPLHAITVPPAPSRKCVNCSTFPELHHTLVSRDSEWNLHLLLNKSSSQFWKSQYCVSFSSIASMQRWASEIGWDWLHVDDFLQYVD